ncbi:protein slx4 [Aspergillus saccharolyticus JOP 1030-1]|uniref:Structure-specific endonuclease subunit SLX4 n=1 Tax=Aspergillus saccharolyticus JOP 1030-1 TaxID=1450539 RepID=A0A318Z1T8_9EURO|nr:hypothetical protein BP01DRAFT_328937 [Aspergillus saccharolyticus JOP 1030-1]PYH40899.1 hypothetical protein BP01DRAFT_328937 [Aspergillus saccharolyticus JOP 1030-1]
MTATADVIVLSSSPEQQSPIDTPAPLKYDAQKLFDLSPIDTTTAEVPSPSDLFQNPTRSRFFENEKQPSKRAKTTETDKTGVTGAEAGQPKVPVKKRGRPKKKAEDSTTTKRATAPNRTIIGRVAKTSSSSLPIEGQADKKTNCSSTPQLSIKQNSADDACNWEKHGLELEQALKRRLDWTPLDGATKQSIGLDDTLHQESNDMRSFGTMLSEFGFGGTAASRAQGRVLEENGPTKRRRIEVCPPDEPLNPKSSAVVKKTSKPTKKFSTLTARVTAQYLAATTEGMDNTEESDLANMSSVPTSKKTMRKTNQTKPQEPELVILSPEAAVKSLNDQELVFGTCSQLEREDSPTTIRELQTAIWESEQSLALERSTRANGSARDTLPLTVSRFTASRKLWSVASRDVDGSVLPLEIVDLADGPDTPKARAVFDKAVSEQKKDQTSSTTKEEVPTMPHFSGFTDAQLSKRIAKFGFKPIKSRPKMIEILTKCWESEHGTAAPSVSDEPAPKPPTSSVPTLVPKASNKPTKTRKTTTTKITNTESQPKTQPDTTFIKTTTAPVESATTSTYSFANIEEIQDSEDDESIPSPSRLQAQYLSHNAAPQPSLPTTITPTIPLSPSKEKATTLAKKIHAERAVESPNIHDQISQAVYLQRPLRPTSASRQPSWHEKILMYDSIFLEDFTTWLNTEGLGLVNEDREVGAALVKEWCEARGVCCCYRPKGRE